MRKLFAVIIALTLSTVVKAQVARIEIKNIPVSNHASGVIYAAGSFNNWNPKDEKFKFQKDDTGNYFIELKLANGNYEYKITRGGWDKVECKKGGAEIANRVLKVESDITIQITVEEWADNIHAKPKRSTASKNVKIIDTAFHIPQLNRMRRVLIYLPDNYATSGKRYPVMYLHDGQNVFDDATSYAGEWGIDEYLDSTKASQCIVVAIDNGGNKRMNEYCPYDFTLNPLKPKENKGEGVQYVDFLAKTLKPFIDKKYRTLKNKKNTFISGASMGGLISFYAVLKYPKVFGGAGVFSPSVWICKEDLLNLVKTAGKKVNSKIYFYCGKLEGPGMVPDMLKVFQELAAVSKSKMTTVIRDDGKHNEPTWRKEFPLFYEWIIN
ncbi:MAG TPA: alpha/beta hydrolase-fold protein [Chitinophagaceae bacterium]|nr:alpha/beta hydrolase-fold protein [Chitinophagaceae bacterium]